MDFLSGQTKNAEICKELRRKIPEELKHFIDIKPKKSGMTLISLFDFASMRGIDVTKQKALEALNKFKKISKLLISSDKDEREKLDKLKQMGFKERNESDKKHLKDYLEEDVQAFLIRELLSSDASSKSTINMIQDKFGFKELMYLTSELEWSLKGKQDRIDILCCDKLNPKKILILEIKKVRLTNLDQGRYVTILSEHNKDLLEFVSALTDLGYSKEDKLEINMVYVMPDNQNKDDKFWKGVLDKKKDVKGKYGENKQVNGIIFYQTGFPSTRQIKRD